VKRGDSTTQAGVVHRTASHLGVASYSKELHAIRSHKLAENFVRADADVVAGRLQGLRRATAMTNGRPNEFLTSQEEYATEK
jgi:hypothetical protein